MKKSPFPNTHTFFTMDSDVLNLILVIIAILVGSLAVVAGILLLVWSHLFYSVQSVVIALYYVFFGVSIILLEIFWPPFLVNWAGFYTRWLGKGLFFIFLGFLILNEYDQFFLAAGIIIIIVGAVFVILHFANCGSPRPLKGDNTDSSPPKADDA